MSQTSTQNIIKDKLDTDALRLSNISEEDEQEVDMTKDKNERKSESILRRSRGKDRVDNENQSTSLQ